MPRTNFDISHSVASAKSCSTFKSQSASKPTTFKGYQSLELRKLGEVFVKIRFPLPDMLSEWEETLDLERWKVLQHLREALPGGAEELVTDLGEE